MRLKQHATVVTAEGNEVGRVDRVVMDPTTKEVTHVVVHKGFLFAEDKVVPISLIDAASEERVTLREDAGDLQALPVFEETHYVQAGDELGPERGTDMPPPYWYQPAGDLSSPRYIAEKKSTSPTRRWPWRREPK